MTAKDPSPKKGVSKFDVSLSFCSSDDAVAAVYHKLFREIPKVSISRQDVFACEPGDATTSALIVPMPSAFGLVSQTKGYAHDLIRSLTHINNYLAMPNS